MQDPGAASSSAELARQAFPRIAERLQSVAAFDELVFDVVGLQQRQQGIGLASRSPVVPAEASSIRTCVRSTIAAAP